MGSDVGRQPVPPTQLRELYQQDWRHNLKIVLFYALLIAFGWAAWLSDSLWVKAPAYLAMGYLWMGIVTFMHDATHQVLFGKKWKNWAFGVFSMLPLIATYIAFKEDHLEHHRFNRSPQDPDAFTMGQRGVGDFVLFYSYVLIGGILTVLQFNFIFQKKQLSGLLTTVRVPSICPASQGVS